MEEGKMEMEKMEERFEKIELERIMPNRKQPRSFFNEETLKELAANIKKHGLLQPLLVRPIAGERFELVLGERRYRACKMGDVTRVTCEVRELTDEEALDLSLSENLQREDLTPIEEALAYKQYLDMGYTQEQIADKVDKTRSRIAQMLALLKLSPHIQNLMNNGGISERHGRELLKLQNFCSQFDHEKIIGYGISETLKKIWNNDHTISFGEAMDYLERNDLKKDFDKAVTVALSLLIGINHIPDHVATRIKKTNITVKDLEQLNEDIRYAIIHLQTIHDSDFGLKDPDIMWMLALSQRRGTNDRGRCFWDHDSWMNEEGLKNPSCTGRMEVQCYLSSLKAKVWFCHSCAKVFDEQEKRDK